MININSSESIKLPGNKSVNIPKMLIVFPTWEGKAIKDTYGGKAVLDYKGSPLFAELYALRLLEMEGWKGVWVDNYRNCFRDDLPEASKPVELPEKQRILLDKIIEKNGTRSGCWDIFAWKDDKLLFAELKRKKKDEIRENQIKWLSSISEMNLSCEMLFIEWETK